MNSNETPSGEANDQAPKPEDKRLTPLVHSMFKMLLRGRISASGLVSPKLSALIFGDEEDPFWGDWSSTDTSLRE